MALLTVIIFLLQIVAIATHTNITFNPDGLTERFYENDKLVVQFNLTLPGAINSLSISASAVDRIIADVVANRTQAISDLPVVDGVYIGQITVLGRRLGRTDIEFFIHETGSPPPDGDRVENGNLRVIVLRRRRVVDSIFRYGIITLSAILYIGFGCKINIKLVWKILKRPISPGIGFTSQFIVMPLLGFALGQIFSLENALSFGLLTLACSPGGGSSNVWVNLFDGSLDLSLTMTTISTFASLGMMPLWIYALGHFYIDPDDVPIPYVGIVRSLLTIIIPCAVGLIIRYFGPKVADKIAFLTRPFSGIFVIYILTFGTYVNFYMYEIMGHSLEIIPAAMLLPLSGYICGFLLALAARRDIATAATISIETGVQNASIPIIILQGSFPQPEGDVAAVMPVASSLFFNIPIIIVWIIFMIYRQFHPKSDDEDDIPIDKDVDSYNFNDEKSPPEDLTKRTVATISSIDETKYDIDNEKKLDNKTTTCNDDGTNDMKNMKADYSNDAYQSEAIEQYL